MTVQKQRQMNKEIQQQFNEWVNKKYPKVTATSDRHNTIAPEAGAKMAELLAQPQQAITPEQVQELAEKISNARSTNGTSLFTDDEVKTIRAALQSATHSEDLNLNGILDIEKVDDKIHEWHNGNSKLPLHTYLGMTEQQYAHFVHNKPAVTPTTHIQCSVEKFDFKQLSENIKEAISKETTESVDEWCSQSSLEIPPLTDEQIDYLNTEHTTWPKNASNKTIGYCMDNFCEGVRQGYQQAIDNIVEPVQGSKELKGITDEDLIEVAKILYECDRYEVSRVAGQIKVYGYPANIEVCIYTDDATIGIHGKFDIHCTSTIYLTAYDFLRSRGYNIPNKYQNQ